VIHNYRWRLGLAKASQHSTSLEIALPPAVITVLPLRLSDANGRRIRTPALCREFTGTYRTGISRAASGTICAGTAGFAQRFSMSLPKA